MGRYSGAVCLFFIEAVGCASAPGPHQPAGKMADWVQVAEHAAWSPRDSCGELVFQEQLWLMGGWFAMEGPGPRDVWTSHDGRQWRQVCAQAPWTHADLSVSLVFKDRMWLMGGWCGGRSPDASASSAVWSSADGAAWRCETRQASWRPRLGAAGVVFHGKIWILGGSTLQSNDAGAQLNDVWCSPDGRQWTCMTEHAEWSPRAYHAAVAHKGKLWVLGGGNYRLDHADHNDVWSSADGVHWTQVVEHTPWDGRIWFSGLVYRDCLWVVGGWSDNPSHNFNDVWYSRDGLNWYELKTATIWSPRHEMSAWVFQDAIWIAGGNPWPVSNDVWRLTLPRGFVPSPGKRCPTTSSDR